LIELAVAQVVEGGPFISSTDMAGVGASCSIGICFSVGAMFPPGAAISGFWPMSGLSSAGDHAGPPKPKPANTATPSIHCFHDRFMVILVVCPTNTTAVPM